MTLPDFWFILITVLWTGYFFLEGFDFGVGILLRAQARNPGERRLLINIIGPVWDGNEVWVLTAVGATLAAFPAWYAQLLSGFYFFFLAILVCMIIRVIALEYRAKREDARWKKNCEEAVFYTSLLLPFLWGMVLSGMTDGIALNSQGHFDGSIWCLFTPYNIFGGVFFVLLSTLHGALFVALKTRGVIRYESGELVRLWSPAMGVIYAAYLLWGLVGTGSGLALVFAGLGLATLLSALYCNFKSREGWAFALNGIAIAGVIATLFAGMFPDVMPSTLNDSWSLTVTGAASSHYTLTVMTIVAVIFAPLVIAYQAWTYWVFRKRIGVRNLPGENTTPAQPAVIPLPLDRPKPGN
ncbi:cytochrome d ubiquinol oxidase subunit II [Streptomyces fractus]|uniref:cytochrome d ubiquinol oxidase subunit II n=1 Tax=Streptomyces fractus TaxID=641806 RepID=UPI003CF5F95E